MQQDVFQPEQWQTLARDILREAKNLGATSAEVDLDFSKGFTVSSRLGEIETVEYTQDKSLEISVYLGQRSGTVSLSDMRWEAIQPAIQAACNIARYTQDDPYAGLADRADLAYEYPQLELAFPWDLSVEQAMELACSCEKEALGMDKRITNSEGATVLTSEDWHLYANSEDFMGFYPSTLHELSLVLVAKEKEEMQRDYSYSTACDPTLLTATSILAKQAVERTVNRLGAQRIPTQRVPVIFLAEEARGLLGAFASAMHGENLYRKSSFLYGELGKQIFPSFITIGEQPHLLRGLGSEPFDGNGVATRPNVFIENGILRSYAMGVYSARQMGFRTTGNAGGVRNLIITPGKQDLADLIKTMGRGLLVTELMGQGVNLVTGDYSRGAVGYWVENGEIQYPVQEVTVAGNLRDIYARIVEVGSDVDIRGNVRTGSILIEELMIAGA